MGDLIILTGFEPFGGEKINPSWESVKDFDGMVFNGFNIKTLRLPVSYKRAKEKVEEIIGEMKPLVFLSFGEAGGRTKIFVERVALNLMDSDKADNDGYKVKGELIYKDAPLAYFSNLPVNKIVNNLQKNGIPAKVSNHAGTYVCNLVFYTALHHSTIINLETKVGFIHVPYAFEQVMKKDKPAFPLEYIKKAVKIIIESIVSDLKDDSNH